MSNAPFPHSVETVETLKQYYLLVPSHVREVYLYHLLCNPPESILHLRREPPAAAKKHSRHAKNSSSKRQKPAEPDSDDPDAPPKQPPPTIIFVRHPKTAAYLTTLLQHLEIRATALHSYLSQPARLSSLQLFRASVVPVLVCTDVASRGLDMEGVGLVINWDMPTGKRKASATVDSPASGVEGDVSVPAEDDVGGAEEYVHRVGRTARMGKGGVAVSFITERQEDAEMVEKIEQRISSYSYLWFSTSSLKISIDTKLTEYSMPESTVLEKLNLVSTAKRTANMVCPELCSSITWCVNHSASSPFRSQISVKDKKYIVSKSRNRLRDGEVMSDNVYLTHHEFFTIYYMYQPPTLRYRSAGAFSASWCGL